MNTTIKEIPYKPSLILQVLMFCNVYLSIAWNMVYGFYILYNFPNLYDLHGICVMVAYFVGFVTEFYRLRMGYKGNLLCRPGDLCTFLILSPFVQMPVLVFLLLSAKYFSSLITTITFGIIIVMALELVVGLAVVWPKSEKPINGASHNFECYQSRCFRSGFLSANQFFRSSKFMRTLTFEIVDL